MSPERIKVMTLVDHLGAIGGGERLAMEIPMHMDRDRFEPLLCASRFDPAQTPTALEVDALSRLRAAGVPVLGLGRGSSIAVWRWAPLWRLLRKEGVQVLHAHKFGSNVWGVLIGRLARVPAVLAHEHTWSFEGRPLRRFLDRNVIARLSDVFIAVSEEDRRRMIKIEGISPEDVLFVPNGIATPASPSGHDVRAELGIPEAAPLVLAVAGLRPQKALEVLVAAVARLRDELPGIRLLVAGEGPERPRLEELIQASGLQASATLLGSRTDIPDLLHAADVLASSSDFEGSPLALMEYMESGRPIVATAVGGVPDLIDNDVHGLLVRPRDPGALATALAEVIRDPERAKRLGTSARERRRREFDLSVLVRRLEGLYEEILASKPRRGRQYGRG